MVRNRWPTWPGIRTLDVKARGIDWDVPPSWTMKTRRDNIKFYMDGNRRLYHNRIAKFLDQQGVVDDVNRRLEKYFDLGFVDEVQDFAGHDFNFLTSICQANIGLVLLGDYFQHTFDTSRDGAVNKSLYDNYEKYVARLEKVGLDVDRETLKSSYRCSPTVCKFISDVIGIEIDSHRSDDTKVSVIDDEDLVEKQFNCSETVKLFYAEHYKYPCYSQNWGASKGEDHYEDVCVVLSQKNYRLLQEESLHGLNPQTRNKLYVACSRARNNLTLACEKHVRKYKVHL
jgi:superfamily I DNA/RNA helicase